MVGINKKDSIYYDILENMQFICKLHNKGMVSYKLIRDMRICREVLSRCFNDNEKQSKVMSEIANELCLTERQIRNIFSSYIQIDYTPK